MIHSEVVYVRLGLVLLCCLEKLELKIDGQPLLTDAQKILRMKTVFQMSLTSLKHQAETM